MRECFSKLLPILLLSLISIMPSSMALADGAIALANDPYTETCEHECCWSKSDGNGGKLYADGELKSFVYSDKTCEPEEGTCKTKCKREDVPWRFGYVQRCRCIGEDCDNSDAPDLAIAPDAVDTRGHTDIESAEIDNAIGELSKTLLVD